MESIASFALCIKLVKVLVRSFPLWLSTPITATPKISGSQQNKKAYGDPPDSFPPSPNKSGKKWSGDETSCWKYMLLKILYAKTFVLKVAVASLADQTTFFLFTLERKKAVRPARLSCSSSNNRDYESFLFKVDKLLKLWLIQHF